MKILRKCLYALLRSSIFFDIILIITMQISFQFVNISFTVETFVDIAFGFCVVLLVVNVKIIGK